MTYEQRRRWVVATAFDDRYLWPWLCSLHSAVTYSTTEFEVLVANVNGLLSQDGRALAEELLNWLGLNGTVIDIDIEIADFQNNQWNATIFSRLALLDTLKSPFMWLDSDTLLRQGWDHIFTSAEIAFANEDVIACAVRDRELTHESLRARNANQAYLKSREKYFNSGILLLHPERWRNAGLNYQWIDLVNRQNELGFNYPDQDVLNYLLHGNIHLLDARYNHIVSESQAGEEVILHFAGFPKPWKLSTRGRAFFIAVEALNFNRPHHQISGGGLAWQCFPEYWRSEEKVLEALEATAPIQLRDQVIALRDSQIVPITPLESIKLKILRIVSRKFR